MTDFSSFAPAPAEDIEIAVKELLLADATISALASGRIYRLADPLALPDRPVPFISVSATNEDLLQMLNAETETSVVVGVGLLYYESEDVLDDDERGVKSWAVHLRRTLLSNPCLEGSSRNGGAAVAQRLEQIRPVGYGPVEVEDERVGIYHLTAVVYQYLEEL